MGAQQDRGEGWPRTIRDLKPSDFFHGDWMTAPDGHSRPHPDAQCPSDVVCGTRCCLVGWARISFGLRATPDTNFTDEAAEFLIKFLEFAGYGTWDAGHPYGPGYDLLQAHASDCFEGERYHQRLTPEMSASAWKKTREHFGYTEVS